MCVWFFFFFFKQKTAYEMRISDWSSDVCSSDLALPSKGARLGALAGFSAMQGLSPVWSGEQGMRGMGNEGNGCSKAIGGRRNSAAIPLIPYSPYSPSLLPVRSEEHTSELQSIMRISYAVFCLNNKK